MRYCHGRYFKKIAFVATKIIRIATTAKRVLRELIPQQTLLFQDDAREALRYAARNRDHAGRPLDRRLAGGDPQPELWKGERCVSPGVRARCDRSEDDSLG